MSYHTILVHLDESIHCATRLDVALTLAGAHNTCLLGLAPTGATEISANMAPAPFRAVEVLAKARADLHRRAVGVVAAFQRQVEPAGLVGAEGLVEEDDATASLVRHGRCADLIVVSQFDPGAVTTNVPSDLPQRVVLQAGRPVLVVPYAGKFATVGRDVIVAWKDSRETARAMADALPLLHRANKVHLLSFAESAQGHDASLQLMNAHCEWLLRHGVKAEVRLDVTEVDTGNALLSRASDLGADLIVMGGYGHSRVREFVLGGVTRILLRQMTVPVMMCH